MTIHTYIHTCCTFFVILKIPNIIIIISHTPRDYKYYYRLETTNVSTISEKHHRVDK